MSALCGKPTPDGTPCERRVAAPGAPCGAVHAAPAAARPAGGFTVPAAAPADPLGADGATAASPDEVRRRAPELVYSGASVRSAALELGVSDDDVRAALDAAGREEAAARRAPSRFPDGATAASPEETRRRAPELVYSGASVRSAALELGVSDDDVRAALDAAGREEAAARRAPSRFPDGATAASPEETRRRAPGMVAAGAGVRSAALELGVSDDDVRAALDAAETADRSFPPLRNGVAGQLAACRALHTDGTAARVEAVFAQVNPDWLAAHGTVEHAGPNGQLIRVRDYDGVSVLAHVDPSGDPSIIGFSYT